MFEYLGVLLVVGIVFGSLYFVYKFTTKMNGNYGGNNIVKLISTFSITYKMNGYILKIGEKYYLCCENCGIIEIDYSGDFDKTMKNPSFQSMIAKQMEKINAIKK